MKVGISLLLLAITVAAVSARYRSGYDCRKYCGRKYVPVCSTEGTTYDNECMMRCDWSVKDCDGKCPCYKPPPRPIANKGPRPIEYYRPRPNEHNGPRPIEYYRPGSIDHNGPRPIEYHRPRTIEHYEPRPIEHYEPLSTYYYEPSTPSDCNCGPDKDKVCTADGETYDNECEANCDGKVAVCDGQCPCS